ncbi:MAG: hypothetical protein Q9217_005456 [Psora testacea]
MPSELLDAIERLWISTVESPIDSDANADDRLYEHRRRRKRPTPAKLKKTLEEDFLRPHTAFGSEWLNKFQQRWDVPISYERLYGLAPTQTRTITRFTREGLEGKVTGYKEVTVPANSATAKNSTSLLRKPANRADFVRGAAGFFPFAPGGLEGITAVATFEEKAIQDGQRADGLRKSNLDRVIDFRSKDGLLEIPPGFTRGLDFSKAKSGAHGGIEKQLEETLGEATDDSSLPIGDGDIKLNGFSRANEGFGDSSEVEDEDIDLLLPVEFPALEPHGVLTASTAMRRGREWAHMVDVKRDITHFDALVPDMARTWPFMLDTFQKEAVYHLENGDSVFVAAHTSAGKTVVAEYAIALAAKHMTKAIYTSPIKALSNQKFRDFRHEFDDVGILTGDVQINAEASCLIMTTEILRSMLYRGADLLRDVEFVIFDEVHYVNDLERGVVWEEVIIMLPEHVTLILLSATVPNTYEFASWVGRTKKKDIYVISTPKRPVPLEHYLWAGKEMHKIVDENKNFLDKGWKEANTAISGRDKLKTDGQANDSADVRGGGNARGGRTQRQRGGPQSGGQQKGGSQPRGRGNPNRGVGNIARTGRGGGRTSAAQDKTVWVHLVQHLRKHDLLPACIFVFSKQRCEQNADALSNIDFCTASEKSRIHMIIERSIARLKPEDRILPQIRRLRDLLNRGIAVHHGGLLPIVKELVEILFAQTLVKVLFATETFAMGLNLPTRTVVFSGFRKHDGRAFRDLLPGEYTQMAGRAGRRGIDSVGTVIIVASNSDEAPPAATLRQMILGDPTKLRSQFRLTYNMILNLLRVEALKIEEMIKRSFSENTTQALLPEQEKQVRVSEAGLAKIKREPCDVCDIDLETCHAAAMAFQSATVDLYLVLVASTVGKRMFSPKRLVVFKKNGIRTVGVIIREGVSRGLVEVLSLGAKNPTRHSSDILPYLPRFLQFFAKLPTEIAEMELRIIKVPVSDIEALLNHVVKVRGSPWRLEVEKGIKISSQIPSERLLRYDEEAVKFVEDEVVEHFKNWTKPQWYELDWGRVKELQTRDLLEYRNQEAKKAQLGHCFQCHNFLEHARPFKSRDLTYTDCI